MNDGDGDSGKGNNMILRVETASWLSVTQSFLVRIQAGEPS